MSAPGVSRATARAVLVRLGLDPEAFLKVARSSAACSQVMDVKGAKMVHGDFTAEGRVSQHLKDERVARALGMKGADKK